MRNLSVRFIGMLVLARYQVGALNSQPSRWTSPNLNIINISLSTLRSESCGIDLLVACSLCIYPNARQQEVLGCVCSLVEVEVDTSFRVKRKGIIEDPEREARAKNR